MGYVAESAFIDECVRPFEKQLWAMKQLGINYLDLRMVDDQNVIDIPVEQHMKYKADLDGIGRKVATIGSPIGKVTLVDDDTILDTRTDKAGVRKSFDEYLTKKGSDFQNALAVARLYGTDEMEAAIRAFSLYLGDGMERDDGRVQKNVVKFLNMMGEAARDGGEVKIALENERGLFGNSPEMQMWLMGNIDKAVRDSYTLCFDAMNYVFEGIGASKAYGKTRKATDRIHVKDGIGKRNPDGILVLAGDEERFVAAGQGDGAYREIIEDRKSVIESVPGPHVWTLEPHLRSSMKGAKSTKFFGDTGFYRFIAAKEALDMLFEAYGIEFK